MNRKQFIEQHKEALDKEVKEQFGLTSINNNDRWDFVMNTEEWYLYAKRCGVRV